MIDPHDPRKGLSDTIRASLPAEFVLPRLAARLAAFMDAAEIARRHGRAAIESETKVLAESIARDIEELAKHEAANK